jgi:thiol-disulfide isomerase/thioredoxin
MTTARSILMVVLAFGILAATSGPSLAESSLEELEAKLAELTKRVEALEREQKPARTTAPKSGATADAGKEQALALYRKIDGLVATGNINQAKRELEAFNEEHAGTAAAGWTRSLNRELEVVGKSTPEDWKIEKWFQGESQVELDGRRPTLLIFWESWCPHCKNEVPNLQKIYDEYQGKGLQVIGVTRLTRTATEESVRTFLADSGVSYPMAKETGELATYFNVKGIPAAAFVRNGEIVWRGHPIRLTDELLGIWF